MSVIARTCARLTLLVAMVAWVVGGVTARVHEVTTVHYVCHEHGQVMEMRASTGHSDVSGPQISADRGIGGADHQDGCCATGLLGGAVVAVAPALNPGLSQRAAPEPRAHLVTAPRPPPLGFAPKTSPPHHA